ncbi:thyroid transcription factor 1-associated protein 26 isoform X2 [Apteryx mantelli]|uniref:Thyroid transcription factor 1-associated protein 26 isoform X2 n=1 Tax=Apteryx mantelli TaxID=2696672 RepID=A0ABM4FVT6_9AVES
MAAARQGRPGPPAGSAGRGPRRKRPWRPVSLRGALGSLQEGQGFAFQRKQKIQREYRKLLTRERKVGTQRDIQFTDTYPEHLKHLYLAEEEKLKKQRKATNDSILSEEELNKAEAEKRKQQREEAQRLYKQKKLEAYKILSKKTKKGQPNLNLQMEFLLQKIQKNT